MTNSQKNTKTSPETQEEALKIAKATQRPGQTKEQTKLVAQGIEKGISHYKKQQKIKNRGLNKKSLKAKKTTQKHDSDVKNSVKSNPTNVIKKQSPLAWILLLISWIGFIAYIGTQLNSGTNA